MGKQAQAGFSLLPKDGTSGGGTEGATATIAEIGFVDEFTYGGRQKDKPQAALRVVYEIDGFDKPWEQHYTCGPSEKYEVVEDGDGIRSTGKATGLNKNCGAFRFFDALVAAEGVEDDLLDSLGANNVRPLEGRRVTLTNVKYETVGGDEKEMVVIGGFSEDEPPAKNGKASGAKGSSRKAASADDIEEEAANAVRALLEEKTSVKKGDLANYIFAADKKNPNIKAIMNLCFKDSFVTSIDGVEFDKKKGILRLAEDDE